MNTREPQGSEGIEAGRRGERPNHVFILADDLGYADLHCYGGRQDCSPNLDRMATEGLRFTNGYATSSVCSPSRFAIATRRYQHRLRGGLDELAMRMDWTPTFAAAAGASAHPDYPFDGIDLFGEKVERTLYWRMVFRNQKAVRSGAWQYLSTEGAEVLFDLARDERERANLRYREPEKFKELKWAHLECDASMAPRADDAAIHLVYDAATMAKSDG